MGLGLGVDASLVVFCFAALHLDGVLVGNQLYLKFI
jgi:hypothetical protein